MKKTLVFLLLFIFTINSALSVISYAEAKTKTNDYELTDADFSVNANSAILMEAETGTVLFSQNENAAASPASVTKIMTLLLVMEAIEDGRISLSDITSISSHAASMGGSQVFLREGERMSVEDLIKCTVIASANDAAVALAELVYGSEESFVKNMNTKALELGLKNTNFENVTGLDDTVTNHVSSALDIAIMSRELIKHPLITKYSSCWQDTIRNGEFTLTNTNRLVRFYDGCNGLKTGSTDKAGFCISTTAMRGNLQLIAVVMGAETRDVRNEIARNLLDFGFSNFALFSQEEKELGTIPIMRGTEDNLSIYMEKFSTVINKADSKSIASVYEIPDSVEAPINKGNVIGKVRFEVKGKILGTCDVLANQDVERINFFGIFEKLLKTVIMGKNN